MTTDTTELKQKLSQQIDTARAKLEALKKDVTLLHEEDMDLLRKRQSELHARLEHQKLRAKQLQHDIASWKNEKLAHTQEAIASWKQQRELEKLQARAEKARTYALDMVTVASYDFEEAGQAVLEAVAARLEADSALAAAR